MSTRCVREGLTPAYDLDRPNELIVDCAEHGFIGMLDAGEDEYGRAEILFQQHVKAVSPTHETEEQR
jgi:hypothetical protein